MKGIKKILIASGVRYDIAVETSLKELATITWRDMKIYGTYRRRAVIEDDEAGHGRYDRFKELFDTYSKRQVKSSI